MSWFGSRPSTGGGQRAKFIPPSFQTNKLKINSIVNRICVVCIVSNRYCIVKLHLFYGTVYFSCSNKSILSSIIQLKEINMHLKCSITVIVCCKIHLIVLVRIKKSLTGIVNHCLMSRLLLLTAVKSSHLSKQALKDYHCPWVVRLVLLSCCYTLNIMGCIV